MTKRMVKGEGSFYRRKNDGRMRENVGDTREKRPVSGRIWTRDVYHRRCQQLRFVSRLDARGTDSLLPAFCRPSSHPSMMLRGSTSRKRAVKGW